MISSLSEPTVDPEIALSWIGGSIAAVILFAILIRILNTFKENNQQRTLTGVAIASGFSISLNISPYGTIAAEITSLFDVIPAQYPEWIQALLTIETGLGLLWGVLIMYEGGGIFAVLSFILALFGGTVLLYVPSVGVFLIAISWVIMELLPADRW